MLRYDGTFQMANQDGGTVGIEKGRGFVLVDCMHAELQGMV